MKLNYKLKNICGSVYSQGQLAFSPSDLLVSPIGNRLQLIDLKTNTSSILALETSGNVEFLDLCKSLLLIADDRGLYLVNIVHDVTIGRISVRGMYISFERRENLDDS
jgi:hypothetical protein